MARERTDEYTSWRIGISRTYLVHVAGLRARVQSLQAETNALRLQVEGITGLDYTVMPGNGVNVDGVPDAVIRLQDMIGDYCTELLAYLDEEKAAHDALARMPDSAKARVLSLHYLSGWTWGEVAEHLGYTYDGIMTAHKRALDAFFDYLPHTARPPHQGAL